MAALKEVLMDGFFRLAMWEIQLIISYVWIHTRAMQWHLGSSAIWYFSLYPPKCGCVALGSAGKPGLVLVTSRLHPLWCLQLCCPPGSTEESCPIPLQLGLTLGSLGPCDHKLAVVWLQGVYLLWSHCAQLCFEVGEFLSVWTKCRVLANSGIIWVSLLCFSPTYILRLSVSWDISVLKILGNVHISLPLTFSINCAAFVISEIQIIAGCCWGFC